MPELLVIETHKQGSITRVTPRGELDLSNADQLQAALARRWHADAHVELDLGQLDFIDSTGLRVVLEATRHAESNELGLTVLEPSARVRRVFEIAGVLERLPITSALPA